MDDLREPMRSFLDAQTERIRAYEDGEYELDDYEGFECSNCGWKGLTAPMADEDKRDVESEDIVQCPECGLTKVDSKGTDITHLQEFGYSYTELPRNIPSGEENQYRL